MKLTLKKLKSLIKEELDCYEQDDPLSDLYNDDMQDDDEFDVWHEFQDAMGSTDHAEYPGEGFEEFENDEFSNDFKPRNEEKNYLPKSSFLSAPGDGDDTCSQCGSVDVTLAPSGVCDDCDEINDKRDIHGDEDSDEYDDFGIEQADDYAREDERYHGIPYSTPRRNY